MQINLNTDVWNNIFQHLKHEDILQPFAQVCVDWNRIAFKRLKELGEKLIRTQLQRPGNFLSRTDSEIISWTLDANSATPKLISKFIRSKASPPAILKAIKKSKLFSMTNEQIMDAIDVNASSKIIHALVSNNPETSKRAFINAIALMQLSHLQMLLHPDTPKFAKFSPEWLDKKASTRNAIDFLKSAICPLSTNSHLTTKDFKFLNIFQLINQVRKPSNITHLDLSGFRAESCEEYQDLINYFPSLISLCIDDKISESSFKFITQQYDLEILSIKSYRLHDLATLGNLKHLKELKLEDCSGLKNVSSEIKKLNLLEVIEFTNSSFSAQEFNLRDLAGLKALKRLTLLDCKIEGKDEFNESLNTLLAFNYDLKVSVKNVDKW